MGHIRSGLAVVLGAALLAACSIGASPSVLDRTITIQLRNYAYDPAAFTVRLGERVEIELRNETSTSHYFGGPELKRYFTYQSPTPNIEVPPHSTKRVRLTAIRAGQVAFTCFVPIHEKLGMVGTITVEGVAAE